MKHDLAMMMPDAEKAVYDASSFCVGASPDQLFADGVHGILLDREKGTHTLALMELEERFRGVGGRPKLRWRGQNRIGKDVSDRKMLLYAIFRRMDNAQSATAKEQGWRGFAAPCMEGRKQAAVKELEDLAASLCTGGSKPSLDKLCTALRQAPAHVELRASKYEEDMLGWGKIPTFPHGNPRARA